MEDELFNANGRTDGRTDMTKLIVAFRNFAKTLKKWKHHKNSVSQVFNNFVWLAKNVSFWGASGQKGHMCTNDRLKPVFPLFSNLTDWSVVINAFVRGRMNEHLSYGFKTVLFETAYMSGIPFSDLKLK